MMRVMIGLVACFVCSVSSTLTKKGGSCTMFTQFQCQDSQCERCDQFDFNQGVCYAAQKGLYAKGTCLSLTLRQQLWSSAGCIGAPLSDTDVPLDKCLQTVDADEWFENICTCSSSRKGRPAAANLTASRPVTRPPLFHLYAPDAGFLRDVLQVK